MKNKPRDRIVEIETIYPEPKLMKELPEFNIYSWGIKLKDGSYANISATGKDLAQVKNKMIEKFIVDRETGEKIEEGKTYKVYEESTDEDEKYWRVLAFVPAHSESANANGNTDSAGVVVPNICTNNGARTGMLFKCAVDVCIAEKKTTRIDIREEFNILKNLLDELETK